MACSDGPTDPAPSGKPNQVILQASHDYTLYEDSAGALSNGAGLFIFAGVTNQPFTRP
jgi:hypothetical protein